MDIPTELARKARELTEGMRLRVNRDPDIADYHAAFLRILPHGNCRVCGESTPNLAYGRKIEFLCVRCSTAIRTGEAK